ncbi:unnamed protein product [Vitrella brassicaformis CCMP3155]|uniref:HTH CENPB-type domain-containing protein n=1 Tax=Vitrella brassicaformis (strain CCMP3155) TaxID=1169540 RepID=A0A0G4FJZ6_VITBC|nr:unnamed protein product [Vitrella brassicaformis CCMP3155]|eukprot:CEM14103.1 unnamed protein product [Vitrella brassicaformis CCMP3155]
MRSRKCFEGKRATDERSREPPSRGEEARAVEEGHHDGKPQLSTDAGLTDDTFAAALQPMGWPHFSPKHAAAFGMVGTDAAPFGHSLCAEGSTASRHRTGPLPPSLTRQSDSQMRTKNAVEVTIGERLQLVDEFESRKRDGEAISMLQFAKEKGITPPTRFKQWCIDIKKQTAAGKQIVDPTKKRNRQPKYQPIEDAMWQWMASRGDPMKVPPKDIRAKAIEIASRLGITGFSASDSWTKAFRKRCQQIRLPSSEAPVSAAAARPPSPMQPPHPHPPPRPLIHQSEAAPAAAAADAAADAYIRVADGFLGPITNLSRQSTWPAEDSAPGDGDRPLDTQSQPSEPPNTI